MSQKIIFLDVDGTLIPTSMFLVTSAATRECHIPDTHVALINELCHITGAKLVMNTTHSRPSQWVPSIIERLIEQGIKREYFHHTRPNTAYPNISRQEAISAWIHEEEGPVKWVALDDVFCAPETNMVRVDPNAGVTVADINSAIALLDCGDPIVVCM